MVPSVTVPPIPSDRFEAGVADVPIMGSMLIVGVAVVAMMPPQLALYTLPAFMSAAGMGIHRFVLVELLPYAAWEAGGASTTSMPMKPWREATRSGRAAASCRYFLTCSGA